jgi:SAM-dependent methyltransferase
MTKLIDLVSSLHPRLALDVGCGCGEFARSVTPHCESLVCIDVAASLRSRWRDAGGGNVAFCSMDARRMGFPAASFPVVFERASLHHVADWETALDEMFRVSSGYVILEEPVDDPRSVAKRNTIHAQDLFLELQHEVGYSHYRHLESAVLLAEVARRGTIRTSEIIRMEGPVRPDDYFAGFSDFAAKTHRPHHWESRLRSFLKEAMDGGLCRSDLLVVLAEVAGP